MDQHSDGGGSASSMYLKLALVPAGLRVGVSDVSLVWWVFTLFSLRDGWVCTVCGRSYHVFFGDLFAQILFATRQSFATDLPHDEDLFRRDLHLGLK